MCFKKTLQSNCTFHTLHWCHSRVHHQQPQLNPLASLAYVACGCIKLTLISIFSSSQCRSGFKARPVSKTWPQEEEVYWTFKTPSKEKELFTVTLCWPVMHYQTYYRLKNSLCQRWLCWMWGQAITMLIRPVVLTDLLNTLSYCNPELLRKNVIQTRVITGERCIERTRSFLITAMWKWKYLPKVRSKGEMQGSE